MLIPKFGPNDKVFAKLRGYPPWPARVDSVADETPSKIKYHVYFYGTGETAVCKQEELCLYVENKEKYGKPMKKKGFNTALAQIDAELGLAPPIHSSCFNEDHTMNSSFIEEPGKSGVTSMPTPKNKHTSQRKRRKLEESDVKHVPKRPRTSLPKIKHVSETQKPTGSSNQIISRSGRKITKTKAYSDESEDLDHDEEQTVKVPSSVKSKNPLQPVKSKATERSTKVSVDTKIKNISNEGVDTTTPDGQNLTLKLNLRKPRYLKGKKELEKWKGKVLLEVEELKSKLQSGEMSLEEAIEQINVPYNKTMVGLEQKRECPESCEKLNNLNMEAKLIDLNLNIIQAANVSNPDPDACLRHLDEIETSIDIKPLLVKKNPEIVDTLKKLTKYVPITTNYPEDEAQILNEKAGAIRIKAKGLCDQIKSLFEIPTGKSFSKVFFQVLLEFRQAVDNLSSDELILLTDDPTENLSETSDNHLTSHS